MADNLRFIRPLAVAVLLMMVAGAAKWAVSSTGVQSLPSAALPTAEELDSLRGYVVRSKPLPLPVTSMVVATEGGDGFIGRSRSNQPGYPDEPDYSNVPLEVVPAQPAVPAAPRWVVSTIMITDTRRVAVLNGALVTPGQTLSGGARVITIESDRVVLAEANGARRELPVRGGGE